jgi:DTW domain-containing protein YfiP
MTDGGHYARSLTALHELMATPAFEALQTCTGEEFHHGLLGAAADDLPGPERMRRLAGRHLGQALLRQRDPEFPKCPFCWISIPVCYCARIPWVPTAHRFFVFMASKEFQRLTNTGKLLLRAVDGELLVMGLAEHEARIADLCRLPNTCVLYPAPYSLTVAQFHAQIRQRSTAAPALPQVPPLLDAATPMNFILLDATWPQARTLVRCLPRGVAFVRVDPPEGYVGLFNGLRRQTTPDRISTFEAGVMLLRDLGLPEDVATEMDTLMKYHVDLIRRQSHRPSVFQTFNTEKYDVDCHRIVGIDELPSNPNPTTSPTIATRPPCASEHP